MRSESARNKVSLTRIREHSIQNFLLRTVSTLHLNLLRIYQGLFLACYKPHHVALQQNDDSTRSHIRIAIGTSQKGGVDRDLAQQKYDQYKAEAKNDDEMLKHAYGSDVRMNNADFIQVDDIHKYNRNRVNGCLKEIQQVITSKGKELLS